MPAAGMRRTTRVFGMKGADSARVLRSGRRLWPESGDAKTKRVTDGEDWVASPTKVPKLDATSPRGTKMKRDEGRKSVTEERNSNKSVRKKEVGVDRRFGIVYERRRKRFKVGGVLELSRKEVRIRCCCVLGVVVDPFAANTGLFLRLLCSILRYVSKVRVSPAKLSAFFMSEPICGTLASRGMQFLKGPPSVNIGICQFFGIMESVPLISVDFSAVPLYFEYLHSAMLIKSMFRSFILVHNPVNVEDIDEDDDFLDCQNEQQISCNTLKKDSSEFETVTLDVIETNESLSLHSPVKATRVSGRNGQYRNILNSRGIQKRRSSLRKRKARTPSMMTLRRSNVAVTSDLKSGRKSNSQMLVVPSSRKLRSMANCSTTRSMKEASSVVGDSKERLDSSLCYANLLVTELDLCYRVEGVFVTLEMSASREWLLTVKKDGLTRCAFKAEKVMRPNSSNRFTHAVIYSLDNGWKLEFANRQDWKVFKDLYKKCSDRNVPAATAAKFIPVPGVREVSSYAESNSTPFHRPDTYISVFGDELTRAMSRTTANYDMDSEDDEWLKKFNDEFQEHVAEDNFELIIDALEKVYYCNPDDSFDEKSAVIGCQDLGSKGVVEAVYTYWMRKRKQKRSLLLRVFQGHQPKRAPLIPKPLLRKRRSFKRQPSQLGRGNQPSVLKAIAEQDALEENAMLRIEEAKANASKSMEVAIQKRKRAQALAQNADLATYKATMLIRIAEAALAAESVEAAAAYFLD
ncbi:hypothetical protein RJT34_24063 [Clitoria ternatea]|uniref:Enhancer of polycomb-like protein n=1 Tax=Clitoria ternatea TaxID=43366 RepID=A0AAN9FQ06_CLITE